MRAIIVPWHQYPPQRITSYYRIYFEYFKKLLRKWKDEFDFLYLIDHYWDFTQKDKEDLTEILGDRWSIRIPTTHNHWDNLSDILPAVKEDKVLIMDLDTLVYKKGLIKEKFDLLDRFDLVSMFDGSGGMRDLIWAKYPILKEKDVLRIGAYFMFARRDILLNMDFSPKYYSPGTYLPELDYTTVEGDWLDSFGEATLKIMAKKPKVSFVEDDRGSVYLDEKGIAVANQRENTGCYHLRNWNLGLHFINESKRNKEAYEKFMSITPGMEACRLLGWLWLIAESVDLLSDDLKKDILKVVKDYRVDNLWPDYIAKCKEVNPWI